MTYLAAFRSIDNLKYLKITRNSRFFDLLQKKELFGHLLTFDFISSSTVGLASKVIFDFTQQGEPFHYIELIPNAEEEKNLKAKRKEKHILNLEDI